MTGGEAVPEIVGLGFTSIDVILLLDRMPTWDDPGPLDDFGLAGGGPVGSACVAAARLGARVGFVGTAGNDELGAMKVRTLSEEGVDTSRISVRPYPEDQVVIVYIDRDTGERVFAGIRNRTRVPLEAAELDRDYIVSADYLHLDGTHPRAAIQAARWMKEAGKSVMVDGSATKGPISEDMRSLVGLCDVLICGSGFGPALSGIGDLWRAGEEILSMGPRIVVQTEGRKGSFTVTPDGRFHQPIYDGEVVDTTGAGDVFHGAYLAGLLRGWNLESITRFATAASAINCKCLGCRKGMPTFTQVSEFLQVRGISLPQ